MASKAVTQTLWLCSKSRNGPSIYERFGVIHYSVANMPGAAARTSTYALTNATLPYALELANKGLDALKKNVALSLGVNVLEGKVTYAAVAEALNLEYTPLEELI